MKISKRNTVILFFVVIVSVLVYAYPNGAAYNSGIDGTGASGGGGCGSCHSSATTDAAKVELDSAGVAVTSYRPGLSYTVKISASNGSSSSLPKFGFQVAVVQSSGAGSNPVDAGTFGTLPASVRKTTTAQSQLTETIIEQSAAITATSGGGANGSTYIESIPWTAPAAGTGSVVIYGVMNEVNGNGSESGDKYQKATAVTITEAVVVAPVASVSISETTGSNPTCSGTSVTFTATPTNGGTAPTYQWQVNGANAGTGSTFTTSTLANGDVVKCIMTSNLSGVTGSPATSNTITMTVNPSVTPTVTVTPSQTTICSGTSVNFTSAITNGGTTPAYQWKKNGTNIGGATSSTYSSSALANGDLITLQLTSNAQCANPASVTSTGVTMTVNSAVTPSVSIASGSGTTICSGQNVTFTATPTNGGTTPAYQWKKNGSAINGATSSTYSTTTLANGDVITVDLTSNAACASPTTTGSNSLTMSVGAAVTPTVSIASNGGTSVCSGQNVTFTATPTNGGTTPAYQWYKNGTSVGGATSATYSTTGLANGDVITVSMTSNANCASPASVNSNALTMSVVTNGTPSVTIASNSGNNICSGQNVTLTATPVNGGASPAYQWKKNGSNINGATSATYSTTGLVSGDVITVQLTSNSACVSTTQATSNAITFTVVTNVTPSVSISANTGNTICAGQNVTFTATPTNGGTPTYQWKKNGTDISGATGATYTTNALSNGDVISVVMTSSLGCASPAGATSNTITMSISGGVTPTVSISSGAGTSICAGQSVTFTSAPTNGGTTPTYQWQVNGSNVNGATNPTFTTTTLNNGDVVDVVMTSSLGCVSTSTVTSNTLTLTVGAGGAALLSISSNQGLGICQGTSVMFTATPVNGGATPSYQWQKNGVNVGSNSPTYIDASLSNGDVVTCTMTSSLGCASPAQASSNALNITVYTNPVANITQSNDTLVATPGVIYQWYLNNIAIGGATGQTVVPVSNGDYTVMITDAHGCQSISSAFNVNYLAINEVGPLQSVSVYPNPTEGNVTVDLSSVKAGSLTMKAFDMNGRVLYENENHDLSGQKVQLDLQLLQQGVYFLQISDGKSSVYRKLIINR
jgi:hypothetical protein